MLALAAGLAALLAPAPAAAATPDALQTADAVARTCAARELPAGAAGAATDGWTAPDDGLATVRLEGGPRRGDWDLAVFEHGAPDAVGASTSFGSAEQVSVWVDAGERLAIQACRRAGRDSSVPLSIEFTPVEPPGPSAERISLESVALTGPGDLVRLERLGVEVTDDVAANAATVALYSDADRARLAAAGFDSTTLVADVAAADRADRAAELRAAAARALGAADGARDLPRHGGLHDRDEAARRAATRTWSAPSSSAPRSRAARSRGSRSPPASTPRTGARRTSRSA